MKFKSNMIRFVAIHIYLNSGFLIADENRNFWTEISADEKEIYVIGYIDGILDTITRSSQEAGPISAHLPQADEISAVIQIMDNLYSSNDLDNVPLFKLMPLAISKARWPDYDIGPSIRGLQYEIHNK